MPDVASGDGDLQLDLHIHSLHSSDADYGVADLLRLAARAGLTVIAVTDHDTVEGAREAIAGRTTELTVIPAVELTSFSGSSELHVLGYFVDLLSQRLVDALAKSREFDEIRVRLMINKLKALRFDVTFDEVKSRSKNAVPRGSVVAQAVLTNGRNDHDPRLEPYRSGVYSRQPYHNFFLHFLREGCPGYVAPLERLETEKAVEIILAAHGIPVLAHPGGSLTMDKWEEAAKALTRAGLAGIEVYSTYHDDAQTLRLRDLAARHGLTATAGSDFHGPTVKPAIRIGAHAPDTAKILERLMDLRPVRPSISSEERRAPANPDE